MGRRVGSWVLLAVSFLFGCASSAGAGEGQGRPARPRRRDRDATRDDANRENDTRAAIGLSHGEALASHRELRGLFDLRTAPSARITNALYSGLYDYERHAANKGVFRDTQERGQAVFRTYSPSFGGIVGKSMPQDAYERFVKENLLLWDERLEKGLLGRMDTYRMLFEIVDARRARYGKKAR